MNDIVREYCDLTRQGVDFNDARLVRLRNRMNYADTERVKAMLQAWVEAEQSELDGLQAAWKFIRPILEEHPGWKWHDAVKFMKEHGGLPEL